MRRPSMLLMISSRFISAKSLTVSRLSIRQNELGMADESSETLHDGTLRGQSTSATGGTQMFVMPCGRGIHPSQPVYSARGVAFCTSLSTADSLGSSAAAAATTRLTARGRGPCDRPCQIHRPRPVKQRVQAVECNGIYIAPLSLKRRYSSGRVEVATAGCSW